MVHRLNLLSLAVVHGDLQSVTRFLLGGCDIESRRLRDDFTLLHLAALSWSLACIQSFTDARDGCFSTYTQEGGQHSILTAQTLYEAELAWPAHCFDMEPIFMPRTFIEQQPSTPRPVFTMSRRTSCFSTMEQASQSKNSAGATRYTGRA